MEQTVQSTKQWTETKEQRKARKSKEKSQEQITAPVISQNYIVCLKWGDKYNADYVNKLHKMVARHCTLDYQFVCFTDDTKGIDKNIRTESLPALPLVGWWYKPYILSNELPMKTGTLLFFDLDVVIFRNIDNLFTYEPGKFCIIRDFNRSIRQNWDRMNSSVFRTPIGKYNTYYQDFKKNPKLHTSKNRGDQDWMFRHIRDHVFWPDEWIQSYKWEMRNRKSLKLINGKRNFDTIETPKVLNQTSVAVFHGDPNPADCQDPWVKNYWG
jgi:hypothetical protein